MLNFGITAAICAFIGVISGKLLDNLLGTHPWLLLLFSFFGGASALKTLIDMGKK